VALLITGGTGFLGSYLTRYALEAGEDRVVVLDKYADCARLAGVLDRVTLVEGDVADSETVRGLIDAHGIDRIAHFASILGSPARGQLLNFVKVQTLGVANVLEAALEAKVRRVVVASSVAAYGRQTADRLHEDLVPNPQNPYGSAKVWAEGLGQHMAREFGLDVVNLRFGSIYGSGRGWRGSYNSGILSSPGRNHFMARVEDAVRGSPIVMPRPDVWTDFTYAADAAKAAWLALMAPELPNRLYNVGARQHSIGEYTETLRELMPEADITVSETEAPTGPAPLDTTRIQRDLGLVLDYSLRAGLADYIMRCREYEDARAITAQAHTRRS
jgi:UDP-glucose 4-epimerase